MLTKEKRGLVQKASRACFASSLQRAWSTWQTIVHRHKLLRRALESRQVSNAFHTFHVLFTLCHMF